MNNCILPRQVCVNNSEALLQKIIDRYSIPTTTTKLLAIQNHFGLPNEISIWYHPQVQEVIGCNVANQIIFKYYKPEGPYNTNELLTNFMIEDILYKWQLNSLELYKKKFYTLPCPCSDFLNYPNQLRDFDYKKFIQNDCLGVVANTDVISGGGKHWICFYIENNNILFFNSSSNPPPPQFQVWFAEIKFNMLRKYDKKYTIRNVVTKPLQKSNTECGMWCIMFIASQLLNYKPSWITTATDNDMLEFRSKIFYNKL